MLYAQTTQGEKILATKGAHALCPMCNTGVIAKCGEIIIHHWAHKSLKDCDDWHEAESEWHLNWKSIFPKNNVEVTLSKNGKRHRADIVGNDGTIIELQHSPISNVIIRERETFYENMIWIFDMDYYPGGHMFKRKEQISDSEFKFKWLIPKRSLSFCKKPVYFDFGKKMVLCVTSLSYSGFGTGYYVNKEELISQYGGTPQNAT